MNQLDFQSPWFIAALALLAIIVIVMGII